MKLSIELVPATSWHNNLRSVMSREEWDTLRKDVYAGYHNRCGICKSGGKLSCHEIWEYDDTNHIQKLAGLIALCQLCHDVKHIGFTEMKKNETAFERVVTHFMKINKCDRRTFEEHRKKAFKVWEKRSQHQWKVNIGSYTLE